MTNPLSALLISGSEERHVEKHTKLEEHLLATGRLSHHIILPSPRELYRELQAFLEQSPQNQPVIISYYGHGSAQGWESSSWKPISYKKIVSICCKHPHYIQFINSTCYGQFLVKQLIGTRSVKITGAICDWEADEECYGTAIKDVLRAWPEGVRPEQRLTEDIYSSEDSAFDLYFMPTLRWGAMFDHWFFPK